MIMDTCYSEIGRSTHQHLNNLRRQLGTGVDPAYDYSAMQELQKKLAAAGKQGLKQRSERAAEGSSTAPTSGLDLLKRTLKEVVGVGAGGEDGDSEDADAAGASHRRARSTPADAKDQREKLRNTNAFLSSSRDSLKKLDIENRFRAPPIGSYRPKDVMLRPRHVCHQFEEKHATHNLKTLATEKEVERLQEEGLPFEHLTKPAVSIELQEGIPDRPQNRQRNYQMAKDIPRPDMSKGSKIHFHDNSFTAGVDDGIQAQYPRLPKWDFAKTSTAPDKQREYYFQPGQYAVKWEVSKPKSNLQNIPFELRPGHIPLREVVGGTEIKKPRATIHLPDRSLSRPSAMGSCPLLERRVKDITIAKCTTRKPINDYIAPMYDTSDPRIEEKVLSSYNSFDAFEAMKATKPRQKSTEEFRKSLTRLQHHKIMRSYANDQCLQLAKTNLTQGPVSVELVAMDGLDDKPSLQKRIICKDLKTMAGREPSADYKELPPRGRIDEHTKVMNFERGTRSGDARAETANLSKLAGAITELRDSRSYDALPRQDHPQPSVETY
jgi:hypothetical protein